MCSTRFRSDVFKWDGFISRSDKQASRRGIRKSHSILISMAALGNTLRRASAYLGRCEGRATVRGRHHGRWVFKFFEWSSNSTGSSIPVRHFVLGNCKHPLRLPAEVCRFLILLVNLRWQMFCADRFVFSWRFRYHGGLMR